MRRVGVQGMHQRRSIQNQTNPRVAMSRDDPALTRQLVQGIGDQDVEVPAEARLGGVPHGHRLEGVARPRAKVVDVPWQAGTPHRRPHPVREAPRVQIDVTTLGTHQRRK